MKTNVNIIRKLNDFEVIQRTKDGMFNATALLKQWNLSSGNKKMLAHYLENSSTKEFIEAVENDNSSYRNSDMMKEAEKRNSVLKKSKANKGNNAGTWMHPYLFIDFAMWINPKFKLEVIKFVSDELIKHRHLSGDWYNKLCSALGRFTDTDYREVGKILNLVIFNEHERELRNYATPEQQNELHQLERDICNYIENGFINTFEQFKEFMRKEWRKRHEKLPKALAAAS